MCLRVQRTPLTMSSTARCWPAAREKAALNSGSPWAAAPNGAEERGWCAGVRDGRRESDEDERGPERQEQTSRGRRIRRRAPALSRFRRSRHARGARPLRSRARQGFLRRRLHRRHQGPQVAPDRRGRAHASSCNLEHRGAVGADPRAGDGAGILVQIPHKFFARKAKAARLHAARARRVRASARCSCRTTPSGAKIVRKIVEEVVARRRPDRPRLARRADRQLDARRDGEADRALPHAGLHRQRTTASSPRTSSSAGSTSCARSISATIYRAATSGGCRAITRCRCRAAP